MEDWLRQFKDNLQNRPEPDFEERNWQALQQQLDRRNGRRFAAAGWWLALPAGLLLLASNAWFFWQNRQSEEKLTVLERRLETALAQLNERQEDTVFVKQVIYQTDTIYRTRIVHPYLPGYAFGENFADAGQARAQGLREVGNAGQASFSEENQGVLTSEPSSVPVNVGRVQNPADVAPGIENQPVAYFGERIEDPALAPFSRRKTILPSNLLPEVMPLEKKKTLAQKLHEMRPKYLRLGLAGGWVAPANLTVKNEGGASASLEAQVVFSPNFCLWAEAAYLDVVYSAGIMGGETGIPVMPPPTDEYFFIEAEAPQKSIHYAAGVQYFFNSEGKFKPSLGAGLGAVSVFTHDVLYDFRKDNGIEVKLEKELSYGKLRTGRLSFRLGLEHEFHQNWSWLARGTYRYQWKDKGLLSQNGLGIQAGLMRRF